MRFILIRKRSGPFATGILAMSNIGIEQYFIVLQVQYKQSFFIAGEAEVNNGNDRIVQEFTFFDQPGPSFFCILIGLLAKT